VIERTTRFVEDLVFRNRLLFLLLFIGTTVFMGWSASRLRIDAGFQKQLPLQHEFIRTFLQYQEQFGGANRVIIALMSREGDMFTPEFFAAMRELTEDVFYVPGVDRASVTSIVTPNVRFVEVLEDGFAGGNVVPADFQPTPEGLATVRQNIIKSGKVGQLVANDFTGAIVSAQLLEINPTTGARLDYIAVAKHLETEVRQKLLEHHGADKFSVHIIGFAKVIGDVSDGARGVAMFFGVSVVLTALMVRVFAQSWRFTVIPLICAIIAVIWQLGVIPLIGFGIDPMSILLPFLIFAIGVSHGVQMIRAYREPVFHGHSNVEAARLAFRQLLVPGGLALLTDTIGFLTLFLIDVGIIRELAITASIGVAMIIFTNLFLLPVILSYVRLPADYAPRLRLRARQLAPVWRRLDRVTHPAPALWIIAVATALFGFALWKSNQIQIGDVSAGVPELRPNSRYNHDTGVITTKFSIGVDILTVITETVPNGCVEFDVMSTMEQLEWRLRNLEGVQSTMSIATAAKVINSGWNEGSLKWRVLPRQSETLALTVTPIETTTGLLNSDSSVLPIYIYLTDHRAETIKRVVKAVQDFSGTHGNPRVNFRLATGNTGVMAATNEIVKASQYPILYWVFGTTITLCWLTFRSWRATLCIIAPLALVSLLANALMVYLGIGLKVHTLPVAALGVGIGVDYGIYLYSRLEEALKRGLFLEEAMLEAYAVSGTAIIFTGVTLAASVSMWIFSDLKFQADMGILLTFMFLVNMLGAIILLPAIARWLFRHHRRRDEPPPGEAPSAA
jgi:predicted RND superfamily exporter protein